MNQNNEQRRHAQFQPTWHDIETFKDEETGLVVVVSASDHRESRYSLRVGRVVPAREGGGTRVVPNIPIMVQVANRQVSSEAYLAATLGSLLLRAEEYVRGLVQSRNNRELESAIARESREDAKNKPKMRPGLKKLGKFDKPSKPV